MRYVTGFISAVLLIVLTSDVSTAQRVASSDIDVNIEIVTPLSVTTSGSVSFAPVSASSGTVTMDGSGGQSNGDNTSAQNGTPATITFSGHSGAEIELSWTSPVTLSGSGIDLDYIPVLYDGSTTFSSGDTDQLDGGSRTFDVAGEVQGISDDHETGNYSGTVTITAAYTSL